MSGYDSNQPGHREPNYLAALGLSQAPFTSKHKDEFLFKDNEYIQRESRLHQLIQQNNLLLIVSGEHGVGKTTLLTTFKNSAIHDWSVCTVQANTMMDAYQLLAEIARGFGLQVSSQPATVIQDTLYQYLVTIQRNDQVPVLLIDDAHELPKDALETLFTLADTESAEGSLIRMVLFCEPQIEIMLDSPSIQPFRKRITHTINIAPFNKEQTAEYLKHRLAVSGFTGISPFKPEDINKIYQVSHGIPARINELAHLHLLEEEFAPIDPEILPEEFTQLSFNKKHLAAGAIIMLIVFSGLFLQSSFTNKIDPDSEQVSTTAPPAGNQPQSRDRKEQVIELDIATPGQKPIPPLAEQPVVTPLEEKSGVIEPAKPRIEEPEQVVQARVRSTLPNPVTGSRKIQSILVNGDGFSQDTDVIVSWAGNRKKLARNQVTFENRNQLRIHIKVGSNADNWSIQTDDPKYGKSNIHEFKVTTEPATGLQTSKWINKQNPAHFTLQLLGTYNKYSLTSFAKQYELVKDTAFFATRRNSQNWYTLIHGHFASREEAKQAIRALPREVKDTQPWIRRFDGIQAITKISKKTSDESIESELAFVNNHNQPQSLDLTAHAAWLWSQNPAHYTIQLLGGHNVDALQNFVQKHQLSKQVSFYRTRRNGKEWFVLLYGSYPDRSQAKAAIEQLPADIRATRPWPRRFGDIHGELSSQ